MVQFVVQLCYFDFLILNPASLTFVWLFSCYMSANYIDVIQTCKSTFILLYFTATVTGGSVVAREDTDHCNCTSPAISFQYFTSRLKDPPTDLFSNQTANETSEGGDTRTLLESKFNNVMTLCAMVPLLIFTCLNSFIHQRYFNFKQTKWPCRFI